MDETKLAIAIEKALRESRFFKSLDSTLDGINKALKQGPPKQNLQANVIQPNNNVPEIKGVSNEDFSKQERDLLLASSKDKKDHLSDLGAFADSTLVMVSDAFKAFEALDTSINNLAIFSKRIYDPIYDTFGGMQDLDNVTNETVKNMMELGESVQYVYGNADLSVLDDSLKALIPNTNKQTDILSRVFEDRREMTRAEEALMNQFFDRNMLKINEMGNKQRIEMVTYAKGLGLEQTEVADLMQENIRRTGEASNSLLEEVSAYSKSISAATGQSYKVISNGIKEIILDVQNFGDIQVDEAARIVSSLDMMGVSYQSFGSMVNKFMSFESAASAISDLTSVFGVHLDAMEMMQLANEDEEAFLHRLRDSFDEQGIAMDDLSKAQRNMIASTLSMKATEVDQFFGEDLLMTMDELTEATDEADLTTAFSDMIEQAKYTEKSIDDLNEATLNSLLFNEVGPKRIQQLRDSMQGFNKEMQQSIGTLNKEMSKTIKEGFDETASFIENSVDENQWVAAFEKQGMSNAAAVTLEKGLAAGMIKAGENEAFSASQFIKDLGMGALKAGEGMADGVAKGFGKEAKTRLMELGVYKELTVEHSAPKFYQPMVDAAESAGGFIAEALAKGMSEQFNLRLDFAETLPDEVEVGVKVLPEIDAAVAGASTQIGEMQSQIDHKIHQQMLDIKELLEHFKTIAKSVQTSVLNIPPKLEIQGNITLDKEAIGKSLVDWVGSDGESLNSTNVQ